MNKLTKNTIIGAGLALTLLLSACSGAPDSDTGKLVTPKEDKSVTETPAEEPTETDSTVSGDVTAPGTKLGLNEWATVEFVGTDDQSALIANRLVSVNPVTTDQQAFLESKLPELSGYDSYMFIVEQKKVSGASIVHNADYTSLKPAFADGSRVQEVTMIGWDECKSQSFSKAFDEEGATLTQCLIGAVRTGAGAPDSVIYTKYDTPYSHSDGKPIVFTK